MTRQILGGIKAWLLKIENGQFRVLMANPVNSALPSLDTLAFLFNAEPGPVLFSKNGRHGLYFEVLRSAEKSDTFHLLVLDLSGRLELGERERGLLDGLRCAFAAACIHLNAAAKTSMDTGHLSQVVCCSCCRKLQTGQGTWSYWDHLPDPHLLFQPVSHTVCEACAMKLYGLSLANTDLVQETEPHMSFSHHGP